MINRTAIHLAALGLVLFCRQICVAPQAAVAGPSPSPPSQMTVKDLDGNDVRPLANTGQRAVVLFFVTYDCPITNSYAPEMERIYKKYSKRSVRFYAVYVDASSTPQVDIKHAKDFGLTFPSIFDKKHNLVKFCQASVTPEAAVVLSDGSISYRGRIDDKYIDFGKAKYQATTHELRDAIEAGLGNRRVKVSRTRAVGCYIPSL